MTKVVKKRGRKPKGGKIIEVAHSTQLTNTPSPNVILHLRCKLSDIQQAEEVLPEVKAYGAELPIHALVEPKGNAKKEDVWTKVRSLAVALQNDSISDSHSACFWCTCDFDTPNVYIPKHQLGKTFQCYGCFCSPECAAAFLFRENIEQSVKFERYALLHHMYGAIYDYKSNIQPAPDPHYTLEKFCGTLSVSEYRKLFGHERVLFFIDKPLSRSLPEMFEENGSVIKMRSKVVRSKADILRENFC